MRFFTTLLSLTLLATASVSARWDDPESGLPVILPLPAHESSDPYFMAAVEDQRGRLYCSGDHVFEYDGTGWSVIPVGRGNIVRALALDEADRIWCGGINELGYIEQDAAGGRNFTSLRSHLPTGFDSFEVWDIYRKAGRTLFIESKSLLIWDGVRFEVRPMPAAPRLFSFEFEGDIYVSQGGTGLWRWDGSVLSRIDLGDGQDSIQAAWRDSSHHVVFLAANCLLRIRNGRVERFAHDLLARIRPHLISQAAQLPDGKIAVLTVTAGIFVCSSDGELIRQIAREDGLPSLHNAKISPSAQAQAWIAHATGVLRIDTRNRQSLFTRANKLGGEGRRAVNGTDGGVFVLTTEGIGRLTTEPLRAASIDQLPSLKGLYHDLASLSDGTVIAAGLRTFLKITATEAQPAMETSENIYGVVELASSGPQLAVAKGSSITTVDLSTAPPRVESIGDFPTFAWDLAADATGAIWATFRRDGVYAIDRTARQDAAKRLFAPGRDLPDGFDDPRLFVLGGGTYAYTTGTIVALPGTPGSSTRVVLPGLGIFAAERKSDDAVWCVASMRGREPRLVRLTRDRNGEVIITVSDQVIRNAGRVTSVSRTQEHILWVGGFDGFVRIDTREIGDEPAPRAPIIQAVSWRAGEEVTRLPLAGNPTVDFARTGTIEFQLCDTVDPFAPSQLIETRLAGTDRDWRLTGKSRSLAGLDEGSYTLEARVVGFLGNPGPVVSYTFTIRPPWFRTPLAYFSYVLVFGASLYGAAQWRTRRIRRQNAQLEQLVNTRTEELAQAVSARSAFLANMGHEIRNPLNGVVGLVDTLRARALAPEQKGIVDRIGTCADQLISVIDDVLEYARIDAGRIALRNRAFSVREPVEGAIDILRAAKPEAVIDLQGGDNDLDARVIGDPDRIRHILVNYVSNALKFGGGTPVQVAVRRDGPLLVLAVTDHGPGIAPEEQARLFVRFSRGSAAYRHGIPGTGLGLAACKAYAEAMGGDVSVESEPGHGATFFLRLPFRPADEGAEDATSPSRPDLMVGKRALVVDDQDFNRFVLTDLLGRMGATTDQASSIDEARAAFSARTPDIVFVDFDLAGATGADLATWIRREAPSGRDVPVVATTAFEVDEVRRKCEEAGMDGFLAKPVTAHRLAEVVARIETIRSGGPAPAAPTAHEPPTPSSFLDILVGGDPDKRREIERSTWREVLTEALAAHRALRKHDAALTARHAHRLVSAALILSERELVAAARELNAVAKAGDLASARLAADRLRERLRQARATRSR
ncbi:MAG: response regulator [Opitutaceae bacterium]|nr:response regulator [Opitutaceae bacterium]